MIPENDGKRQHIFAHNTVPVRYNDHRQRGSRQSLTTNHLRPSMSTRVQHTQTIVLESYRAQLFRQIAYNAGPETHPLGLASHPVYRAVKI
jgi:hypothetical protein